MKEVPVKCSSCGGKDLVRLISRHSRGYKGRGGALEDPCCGMEKKDFSDCLPGGCYGRYTIGE